MEPMLNSNMPVSEQHLQREVMAVAGLPIIGPMLQVICHTTGMGFAAVAKVTTARWIACGVRDQIDFGLRSGGELDVKSTICDEIRDSHQAVIIDNVDQDPQFCHHHTPLQYGFKSYISLPILLQNGEFFGTLCAIDPKPAKLNNPETIALFTLFTELLSFHITALQHISTLQDDKKVSGIQIRNYRDEISQYRHLSNHTLQEPLRKIRIFSDLLVTSAAYQQPEKVSETALKINHLASDLSDIIHDITDFTNIDLSDTTFSAVDLLDAFDSAQQVLSPALEDHRAEINLDLNHTVCAIPSLVRQLFTILLNVSMCRHTDQSPLKIDITSSNLRQELAWGHAFLHSDKSYCEIIYQDNGTAVAYHEPEKIFEMTRRQAAGAGHQGLDTQLAQARKIVRLHGGTIKPGSGTTLSIILPLA